MRSCTCAVLVLVLVLASGAWAHTGHVTYDNSSSHVDSHEFVHLYFFNSDDSPRSVLVIIQGNSQQHRYPIPPKKGAYVEVGKRPDGVRFTYTDEPEKISAGMADGQFTAKRAEEAADNRIIGVWRGTVRQADEPPYPVQMTISSQTAGSIEYASLKCGGTLSGSATGRGTYVFSETITAGRATETTGGCIDGTTTVHVVDDRMATWSWTGSWKGKTYTASATLKKDGR